MRISPSLSALLLPFLLWGLAPGPAHAGANGRAFIAVHLVAATTKNPCAGLSTINCYTNLISNGVFYPTTYYGHVTVLDASQVAGVGGATFGLDYNGLPQAGVDIFDWHLCADGEVPTPGWPAPQSGNTIYWDTALHCQRGGPGDGTVSTTLGYFYCAAYSPDDLRIVLHPSTQEATVVDCDNHTDVLDDAFGSDCNPDHLGWATFSAGGNARWSCPDLLIYAGDLTGPDVCAPYSSGNTYTFTPGSSATTSVAWTVRGNAVIAGPADQLTVHVTATGLGLFEIVAHAGGLCAAKRVRVAGAVSATTTTWSGIKGAYAPARRGN